MELISLIRSSKPLISKESPLLFLWLLLLGVFSFSQEQSIFYKHLTAQVSYKRQTSYELFTRSFVILSERKKIKEETPPKILEGRWEMLPQRIKEWQKENTFALFSLSLKALVAEVSKKPEEAKEAKARLSSDFQSLLSQWEAKLPSITYSPSQQEQFVIPPPPKFPPFWWDFPILTSFVPPARKSDVEEEFRALSLKIDKDIDKAREITAKEIGRYEEILKEVRRRCPLP